MTTSVGKAKNSSPAATKPEKKVAAKKSTTEKKVKAPKDKKPLASKTVAHPPYFQMIKEAVLALKERSGSSPHAIAKFMEEKHKSVLPTNFRKILSLQLKNSVTRGKLIKIKASYKLSDAEKKPTAVEKKPASKTISEKKILNKSKPKVVKKKAETVKKSASGKVTKKKVAPAVKPKHPKSIKSPASKKAKKTV